ncbi:MAG: hypothetical protein AAF513_14320 [Pseudomonadota bacterium]
MASRNRSFALRLRSACARVFAWGLLLAATLALTSCAANPPRDPNNLCNIFAEKKSWRKAANKARRKWGVPVHISMAFVHRESHYVANAKPPRRRFLGLIPTTRLSSAYGYAQATDETWKDYEAQTDRWFTDRDNFADAMDFIGWYNHRSHKQLGLAKDNAYGLYLAYYNGISGYRKGHWKKSPTIKGYANKVAAQAKRYQAQLKRCS